MIGWASPIDSGASSCSSGAAAGPAFGPLLWLGRRFDLRGIVYSQSWRRDNPGVETRVAVPSSHLVSADLRHKYSDSELAMRIDRAAARPRIATEESMGIEASITMPESGLPPEAPKPPAA
jgi:hypothetical protein